MEFTRYGFEVLPYGAVSLYKEYSDGTRKSIAFMQGDDCETFLSEVHHAEEVLTESQADRVIQDYLSEYDYT